MFKFNDAFDFRTTRRDAIELLDITLDVELRKTSTHYVVVYQSHNGEMYKIYADYEDAKEMYEMMSQERYGYHNAIRADYRPQSEHEFNGFIRWYVEEDRNREIERDFYSYQNWDIATLELMAAA